MTEESAPTVEPQRIDPIYNGLLRDVPLIKLYNGNPLRTKLGSVVQMDTPIDQIDWSYSSRNTNNCLNLAAGKVQKWLSRQTNGNITIGGLLPLIRGWKDNPNKPNPARYCDHYSFFNHFLHTNDVGTSSLEMVYVLLEHANNHILFPIEATLTAEQEMEVLAKILQEVTAQAASCAALLRGLECLNKKPGSVVDGLHKLEAEHNRNLTPFVELVTRAVESARRAV
jgi:hypothetical protein